MPTCLGTFLKERKLEPFEFSVNIPSFFIIFEISYGNTFDIFFLQKAQEHQMFGFPSFARDKKYFSFLFRLMNTNFSSSSKFLEFSNGNKLDVFPLS